MVSIGSLVYGDKLIVNELEVRTHITGPASGSGITLNAPVTASSSVASSHKVIGSDSMNLGQIHQKGSVFYLQWSHVEQVTEITTTNGSANILLTVAHHGLKAGDYFYIQDLGAGAGDANGIPFADIRGGLPGGGRVAGTMDPSDPAFEDKIPITALSPATSSGTTSTLTPIIRIDRYKFIDMAKSDAVWNYDTQEPTPPHINVNIWS